MTNLTGTMTTVHNLIIYLQGKDGVAGPKGSAGPRVSMTTYCKNEYFYISELN